jgi:hypothetical protein
MHRQIARADETTSDVTSLRGEVNVLQHQLMKMIEVHANSELGQKELELSRLRAIIAVQDQAIQFHATTPSSDTCDDVNVIALKKRIVSLHNCLFMKDRQLSEKDELARIERSKMLACEANLRYKDEQIAAFQKKMLQLHSESR